MTLPVRSEVDGPTGQLPLDLGHNPALGEADFLVGKGNALAHGRVMSYPQWTDPITLLIGPAAAGKSHLARIFAERTGAAFAGIDTLERLASLGGAMPLVIEDVDRLPYDEASLFHVLNQSMRDQRAILMTAREDIAGWPLATDDVRSRARRATAFTLELTDDIHLSQMFVKMFGDRQITVDPKVIAYIAARMERSAEEVMALVDLMDRLALARGTAITRNIAAEALDRRRIERGEAGYEQDWDIKDE